MTTKHNKNNKQSAKRLSLQGWDGHKTIFLKFREDFEKLNDHLLLRLVFSSWDISAKFSFDIRNTTLKSG